VNLDVTRVARAIVAAGAFAVSGTTARAEDTARPFVAMRPQHAKIAHLRGILVRWSNGENAGRIAVRDARRKLHVFVLGFPPRIDGKTIRCYDPPASSKATPSPLCPDWPANVVLGITRVDASYWYVRDDGKPLAVSDEIDVLGSASR